MECELMNRCLVTLEANLGEPTSKGGRHSLRLSRSWGHMTRRLCRVANTSRQRTTFLARVELAMMICRRARLRR
jgi:hypothetical protein